jgi:hypothetical protein
MLCGAVADGMEGVGPGGGAALVSHVVGCSKHFSIWVQAIREQTRPACK